MDLQNSFSARAKSRRQFELEKQGDGEGWPSRLGHKLSSWLVAIVDKKNAFPFSTFFSPY